MDKTTPTRDVKQAYLLLTFQAFIKEILESQRITASHVMSILYVIKTESDTRHNCPVYRRKYNDVSNAL